MNDDFDVSQDSPSEQLRRSREKTSRGNTMIWGAILILIGVVFMLQNLGIPYLDNWWALFILIPAFGAFSSAWRSYQQAGSHLTGPARGSLIGGIILTTVAAIFLLGLKWDIFLPVILILAGVGILVNYFVSREP